MKNTYAHTSHDEVKKIILNKINSNTPSSVIRGGDGEGVVMTYPTGNPDFHNHMMRAFFGPHNLITEEQKYRLRDLVLSAFYQADIVGLPMKSQKENFHLIHKALENKIREDQIICRANLHRFIGHPDFLDKIVEHKNSINLITSRDVEKSFQLRYPKKKIFTYSIPTEAKTVKGEAKKNIKRHFPERFEQIMSELVVHNKGDVFFVGGGPLGKVYCQRVKELGGIALDVGSTFDAWAGVATRSGMDNKFFDEYKLA